MPSEKRDEDSATSINHPPTFKDKSAESTDGMNAVLSFAKSSNEKKRLLEIWAKKHPTP